MRGAGGGGVVREWLCSAGGPCLLLHGPMAWRLQVCGVAEPSGGRGSIKVFLGGLNWECVAVFRRALPLAAWTNGLEIAGGWCAALGGGDARGGAFACRMKQFVGGVKWSDVETGVCCVEPEVGGRTF
jgi:hypothetical protein